MTTVRQNKQNSVDMLAACPYDISHYVRKPKLFAHLEKCRKNYVKKVEAEGKLVEYFPCKHNMHHKLPQLELPYHEENCVNRYIIMPTFEFLVKPTIVITPPPPNEEDIRRFKELADGAKDVLDQDWVLDSIVNPVKPFHYNPAGVEELHKRITMNAASFTASFASPERAVQTQQSAIQNGISSDDPAEVENKLAYMLHESESDEETDLHDEGEEDTVTEDPEAPVLPSPTRTPVPLPRTIAPTPNPLYHYIPINRTFESP